MNQVRLLVPRRSDVLLKLVSVYQQLGQTAEADRVKQAIRELRTPTTASGPPSATTGSPLNAAGRMPS